MRARIPVDRLAPMIRLVELEKYFPLAKGRSENNNAVRYLLTINISQYFSGLFFFTNEKNGEKRLISVIRSCSFSAEENQTGKIGDIKFLLPEGLDRTYYVTEKFLEVNYFYQLLVNLLKNFLPSGRGLFHCSRHDPAGWRDEVTPGEKSREDLTHPGQNEDDGEPSLGPDVRCNTRRVGLCRLLSGWLWRECRGGHDDRSSTEQEKTDQLSGCSV